MLFPQNAPAIHPFGFLSPTLAAVPATGLTSQSHYVQGSLGDEKFQLLRLQDSVFTELVGKYPAKVADSLSDTGGSPKACLNLGCGSGEWIVQVARDFPKCRAVALDYVPIQSLYIPPNVMNEIDDINLGLEHFYGQFNVVHARHIASGIRDFRALIDSISHVLRPGGLVLLAESDFAVYDAGKNLIGASDTSASGAVAYWLELAAQCIRKRGYRTDIASHLVQWVTEHVTFENVSHEEYWIPLTPFPVGNVSEEIRQKRLGGLVRDDIREFLKHTKQMLIDSGFPETFVDGIEGEARQELAEAKTPRYFKLQMVQAVKRRRA